MVDVARDFYKLHVLFVRVGQLRRAASGTLWTKTGTGSFGPLLPTTQQRIQRQFDRLFKELGRFAGRESLTHSEAIQLFRELSKKMGVTKDFIKHSVVADVVHPYFPDLTNFEEQLGLGDTEEKFQAYLLAQPEPSPEQLEKRIEFIRGLFPRFRELMTSRAKALPHDRGGAPRKFKTAEEKQMVRDEIRSLRGPGTRLTDLYARIAARHHVSPSTIKRIWNENPKD